MVEVRVRYPAGPEIVLRTSLDWSQDLAPVAVEDAGTTRVFRVEPPPRRPQLYFKAVRHAAGRADWEVGANHLASGDVEVYPHFDGGLAGRITDREVLGSGRVARVYLPPGWSENTLKRYPTLYVLDGANAFFPEEAFSGSDWAIDETMDCLDAMNLVDKMLVVALYSEPERRAAEYTLPGYGPFGAELVEQVLPEVERRWRALRGGRNTAVLGSSLGGVAALHLAWRHPREIGMAACVSSTFGFADDLLERIYAEPRPNIRVYLDSGLPADNWEATREIHDALVARGAVPGRQVLFLGFPGALHHEKSWAARVHLPIQFLFGRAFR